LSVSRKTNHADLGLPGGKVDPGETPEQALVRELREETSITALRFKPIFEDPCRMENGELRPARTYLVYAWEGAPKAMKNAIVKWVMPHRLLEQTNSFCSYNRKLFEYLEESGEINGLSKK
jgi:8-oxo-dGTP diphosphatase